MQHETTTGSRLLLRAAILRFIIGMAVLGAYLFLWAGTLRYWYAWLYLAMLAALLLTIGVYLFKKDKALLQKRLNTKEKEAAQRTYVAASAVSFLSTFALCGLDYRFGWSRMPLAVLLFGIVVLLFGYALFVATLMQNRFASRVVEVQRGQRVIDTGVYAVVRHPMYTAALLLCFASPLVLGSLWALLTMLPYLLAIVMRIKNEESVLRSGLEGYAAYMDRVKYRIVPFVW